MCMPVIISYITGHDVQSPISFFNVGKSIQILRYLIVKESMLLKVISENQMRNYKCTISPFLKFQFKTKLAFVFSYFSLT